MSRVLPNLESLSLKTVVFKCAVAKYEHLSCFLNTFRGQYTLNMFIIVLRTYREMSIVQRQRSAPPHQSTDVPDVEFSTEPQSPETVSTHATDSPTSINK